MSAGVAFERLGGDFVTPNIMLEASVPLELSGEAVRNRICTFLDHEGREWALRPDLTLPVAIAEVAHRRMAGTGESLRRYDGPVFRLPSVPGDPIELRQTGFERFGAASSPVEDARLYADICTGCQAEGAAEGWTRCGDLSIFPAFVDALDLPPEIAEGLKRAFRQEGGVRAFIETDRNGAASGMVRRLAGLSEEDVKAFVDDMFALTGVQPVGDRSTEDVIRRLAELSASRSAPDLTAAQRQLIDRFLSIDVPLNDAPSELSRLVKDGGLSQFDGVLSTLSNRLAEMSALAPAAFLQEARFLTSFGRRFTYYDGFVFEVSALGTPRGSFAMGGRYDQLLTRLSGGDVKASAIGGVVVPDRVMRQSGRRK